MVAVSLLVGIEREGMHVRCDEHVVYHPVSGLPGAFTGLEQHSGTDRLYRLQLALKKSELEPQQERLR
jgi:hypothetical protein